MLLTSFSGLDAPLSVLCLGVAEHGSAIRPDESLAMLDAFAQAGGNFADTAHVYASWLPAGEGQSERALGRWIRSRQPSNFVVATKGGHPDLSTMDTSRLSPEDIARDVDESLDRLQLDSVELYYLHRDDEAVPVGEVIDALNAQIQSGRITAIGASNWSTARIEEANRYAARRGLTGFCCSQIAWSLALVNEAARGAGNTVQADNTVLDWHRRGGFPLAAYSSQANGYFAHPLPDVSDEPSPKHKALAHSYASERNAARHARATQLAAELGRTPNEIALAYVWSQEFPTVAIIGPRRMEQVTSSLSAGDLRLSSEQVAWLEAGDA